jgi:hypothetical protein
LTPRQTRLLLNLACLAGIAIFLVWLRQAADTTRRPPLPPPGPLDFKLVRERFAKVRSGMGAKEVFDLLGAPVLSAPFREPEFDTIEAVVDAHPDRYPGEGHDRYWVKWTDPADERSWVAVLVVGGFTYHPLDKRSGR